MTTTNVTITETPVTVTLQSNGGIPADHAASHAAAGSDPITIAQSQVTDLTSDLAGITSALGARSRLLAPASGESITQPAAPTTSAAAFTLNTAFATPLFLPSSFTADRIGIWCQTAETAAFVRLGIYSNGSNDRPDSLIVDAGQVDCTATTGAKLATISQALTLGIVWLVAVPQGASSALRLFRFNSTTLKLPDASTDNVLSATAVCRTMTGVSGALPSTWTDAGTAYSSAPVIMLRRS
jgi:hypothetical protein